MTTTLEQIIEFGKELGFETNENGVFLPIYKINDCEWGVFAEQGFPRVYFKDFDCKTSFGDTIKCFTPDIIIKTTRVNDKEFVINKKIDKKYHLSIKGLIYAFKFKDVGSLDPSFLMIAYIKVLKLFPVDFKKFFINEKVSELCEKFEELSKIEDLLLEEEYDSAFLNLKEESDVFINFCVKFDDLLELSKCSMGFVQKYYKIILLSNSYINSLHSIISLKDYGVKVQIDQDFIQNHYKKLLRKGFINAIQSVNLFTRISPKFDEADVKQAYKKLLYEGCFSYIEQLEYISGIKPYFDKQDIQNSVDNLLAKGLEIRAKVAESMLREKQLSENNTKVL